MILQRVPPCVCLLTHTSASIKHHTSPDSNHLLSPHGLDVLAGLCKILLVNSDLRQRREEEAGKKTPSSPSAPLILLQDKSSLWYKLLVPAQAQVPVLQACTSQLLQLQQRFWPVLSICKVSSWRDNLCSVSMTLMDFPRTPPAGLHTLVESHYLRISICCFIAEKVMA